MLHVIFVTSQKVGAIRYLGFMVTACGNGGWGCGADERGELISKDWN